MNIEHMHAHLGVLKELQNVAIPAEAQNVHIEIYYSVQHPATEDKPEWGEPFRIHLVNLPVDTANELVAAVNALVSAKVNPGA